jgi:hypothetical protein
MLVATPTYLACLLVSLLLFHINVRRRDLLEEVRRHSAEADLRRLIDSSGPGRPLGKDARGLANVSIAGLLFLLHKHCGDVMAVRTLMDVLVNRSSSKCECSQL